jgi:hypothetical protein
VRYEILSCSTCGHGPDDCCAAYGCRCVTEDDDGEEEHDLGECECSFEVDNLHRAGSFEIGEDPSDEALFNALVEEGCFKRGVVFADVEIEYGGDHYFIEVNATKTGEPLYQLRLVQEAPAPEPPAPLLEGQVEASEIDPKGLASMRERGGEWFAYRNCDLSSADVGRLQFLRCGAGCSNLAPPKTMPDTDAGLGWRYTFEGEVDLATGLVRK